MFGKTSLNLRRAWCAMAALLLLVFGIIAITRCDGNLFCYILNGIIIFTSLLGLIGSLTLSHAMLGFFMFGLFLEIVGTIVFIVVELVHNDKSVSDVVFQIVLLGLLVITLAFASDLRHTIVIEYVSTDLPLTQPAQTTIINQQPAPVVQQPTQTTTVVQEV